MRLLIAIDPYAEFALMATLLCLFAGAVLQFFGVVLPPWMGLALGAVLLVLICYLVLVSWLLEERK